MLARSGPDSAWLVFGLEWRQGKELPCSCLPPDFMVQIWWAWLWDCIMWPGKIAALGCPWGHGTWSQPRDGAHQRWSHRCSGYHCTHKTKRLHACLATHMEKTPDTPTDYDLKTLSTSFKSSPQIGKQCWEIYLYCSYPYLYSKKSSCWFQGTPFSGTRNIFSI